MYKEDCEVPLALKVSELINVTGRWNREMLFETFAAEDAERIMQIKPMLNEPDSYQWGFTKTGTYTTRSGYQFSESLVDTQQGQGNALPPIEKKFWRSIWKIKAPPKLKHFLWRVLSGVLAVKDRLRSRGISLDTTCQTCGLADETICHTLFACQKAQQAWELSNVPLPPACFSNTFVFLNIFHLVFVMNKKNVELNVRRVVPWVLWHVWKARNASIFKKFVFNPFILIQHAFEEADIWHSVHLSAAEPESDNTQHHWTKSPSGSLKCNVGSSWIDRNTQCGVSWILRDDQGNLILHGRRSS